VTTGNVDVSSPVAQVSAVSEVIVYPGYAGTTGDAALLVLSPPTAAPAIPLVTEAPAAGTRLKIAGWGLTGESQETPSTLQWAETTLQGDELCEKFRGYDGASELCVEDETQSAAPCQGDSGSPLLEETAHGPVELGLFNGGSAGCATSNVGTYTWAHLFAPWVNEAASALGPLAGSSAPLGGTAATPGVYVTVRSATHKVAFRVANDGHHVVHLTIEANLTCDHHRSLVWVFPFFFNESGPMVNGTIRYPYQSASTRSWHGARGGLNLHFMADGLVEGRFSAGIRSRNRHIGSCYTPALKFWAYRARG
jgi:secreted trypsin-like serine protease